MGGKGEEEEKINVFIVLFYLAIDDSEEYSNNLKKLKVNNKGK